MLVFIKYIEMMTAFHVLKQMRGTHLTSISSKREMGREEATAQALQVSDGEPPYTLPVHRLAVVCQA
jgi:hypothetical protein